MEEPKKIPENVDDGTIPASPLQTVEEVLHISPARHTELTWIIDEICEEHLLKADQIKAIAASKATDEEKVLMGFYLCKKYAMSAPLPVRMMFSRWIG